MKSKILSEARDYEAEEIKKINRGEKPTFHLAAPVGWINDPNGFSVFQKEYHLFYQYHPYSSKWGPMHWGHSKTKDFIQWEQLPVALAPDESYDSAGCFSGSAIEEDGQHVLVYTGVIEERSKHRLERVQQLQCIAMGNGIDYKKLECNPILTADMISESISEADFRDPKIWKHGSEFYMVVSCCNSEKNGEIALLTSSDLKQWTFQNMLVKNDGTYGKMWECPDFFELSNQYVLLTSPQKMKADGLEFHSGDGTIYFVGQFDYHTGIFQHGVAKQIDYGFDFYAPQTTKAMDGRQIMIAWMHSWDNEIKLEEQKWNGIMTIPREIELRDGKLFQNPVREIAQYYSNKIEFVKNHMSGNMELEGIRGRELDLEITVCDGAYEFFEVQLAKNEKYKTVCRYESKTGILTFDRMYSGICRDIVSVRKLQISPGGEEIKIRVLLDKYSVELFVNDGAYAFSSLLYVPSEAQDINFFVEGELTAHIVKHDIRIVDKAQIGKEV